jgi:hypothetical protein
MKIFKNIGSWINDKLADTVVARLINWWQTQHPASYLAVSAVLIIVHDWAATTLEQARTICAAASICLPAVEENAYLVVYWASLVIAVLTGTKPISSIRKRAPEIRA